MAVQAQIDPEKNGRYPIFLGDSVLNGADSKVKPFSIVQYNYVPAQKSSSRRARIRSTSNDLLKLTLKDSVSSSKPEIHTYSGKARKAGHVLLWDPARKGFVLEAVTETNFNLTSTPHDTVSDYPTLPLSSDSEEAASSEDETTDSPYDYRKWLPGGAEDTRRPTDTESDLDDDVLEIDEQIVEKPSKVTNALGISSSTEVEIDADVEEDVDADGEEEDNYLIIEDDGASKPRNVFGLGGGIPLSTPAATPRRFDSSSDEDEEEEEEETEPARDEPRRRDQRTPIRSPSAAVEEPPTPPNDIAQAVEDEIAHALTPGMDIDDDDLEATLEQEMRQAEEDERRRQQQRLAAEEESEEE